eukprot:884341-Amphidinium_carterae.1
MVFVAAPEVNPTHWRDGLANVNDRKHGNSPECKETMRQQENVIQVAEHCTSANGAVAMKWPTFIDVCCLPEELMSFEKLLVDSLCLSFNGMYGYTVLCWIEPKARAAKVPLVPQAKARLAMCEMFSLECLEMTLTDRMAAHHWV